MIDKRLAERLQERERGRGGVHIVMKNRADCPNVE